jgi:hypothetical protein
MITRIFGLAVIASVALLAGGSRQASAVTLGCSSELTAATTSNGGTTIAGATNIGTVSAGCEIGPFVSAPGPYTNLSGGLSTGTPAQVNDTANPSIYEFTWGGGNLTIAEELGNNGIKNNINVELGPSTATLNANNTLSSVVPTASITILYQSGPGAPVDVLNDYDLAAGTYYLDTYLGSCGTGQTCTDNDTTADPYYAVAFSTATPLPATLPLFAGGLGFVGYLAKRRKRNAKQALAAA